MPQALADVPPMPDELTYLWGWFLELDAARGSNGFGASPLGYTEIQAWAVLTGRHPEPWEIGALRRFDLVRVQIINEK